MITVKYGLLYNAWTGTDCTYSVYPKYGPCSYATPWYESEGV